MSIGSRIAKQQWSEKQGVGTAFEAYCLKDRYRLKFKRITAKFKSYCRCCEKAILIGEFCGYRGKGKGCICEECIDKLVG